jgi:phosphatidylcholine synthase
MTPEHTTEAPTSGPCSRSERRQAWAVHVFTTSGIVVAMFALQAVLQHAAQAAIAWLLVTQLIDGIDGPMARAYDVRSRVPMIDGYVLDLVIDFVTCAFIPAAFLHQFDMLPHDISLLLVGLVVFSSAIWFSRTDMMTDDHWFRGFPAVWNLIIPTLFLLETPKSVNVLVVVFLCVGSFTNFPSPHPVRVRQWRPLTLPVTILWLGALTGLVVVYPREMFPLQALLIVPLLYFVVIGVLRSRETKSAPAALVA